MSKFFLITYDLKHPERNYSELYEAIKNLGEWWHPLESTWVVKTPEDETSSSIIYNKLRDKMAYNDGLFIIRIHNNEDYQGWLPQSFWNWFIE
ncbi:MAG: hypothetical protein ACOX2D_07840 [Fermentimonas sp.]|jgi:hypothetical protein